MHGDNRHSRGQGPSLKIPPLAPTLVRRHP